MNAKRIIVALVCATLLFIPNKVMGAEKGIYDDWKTTAIITPNSGELKAAGRINVTFKKLSSVAVKQYKIYLDNEYQNSVTDDQEEIKTEIYTTKTAVHKLRIVAVTTDNHEISSSIRSFLVSKKGIGLGAGAKANDMNASWYYNWSTTSSSDTHGEFVPMVWNNFDGSKEWLKQNKSNYVLGFNEPDRDDQANLSVDTALAFQPNFDSTETLVGAPAVSYDPTNNKWFMEYGDKVNWDNVDFIPVHVYYDWGGENMADAFLKVIDDTYQKYHKPIWVTEYGLANYGCYGSGNKEFADQIEQYLKDTIDGLEKRDYVERYAWFSFGVDDPRGGATALYDETTGALTALGQVYQTISNPQVEGVDLNDQYVVDAFQDEAIPDNDLVQKPSTPSTTINQNPSHEQTTAVKTGDDQDFVSSLLFMVIALAGYQIIKRKII